MMSDLGVREVVCPDWESGGWSETQNETTCGVLSEPCLNTIDGKLDAAAATKQTHDAPIEREKKNEV